MMRVSEVIRGWLGWCPNGHTMNTKTRDAGHGFSAGGVVTKNSGSAGSDGSGLSGRRAYEHTQRGTFIIGAISAAIILVLAISLYAGFVWVVGMVVVILVFVLAICSTLTVSVGGEKLRIQFGPVGLIRKEWPLSEIVSVSAVTNPWYFGWGIHWTPRGPLYNVSGFQAVEILLVSGKTFRIGTDEPDALKAAIGQASITTSP